MSHKPIVSLYDVELIPRPEAWRPTGATAERFDASRAMLGPTLGLNKIGCSVTQVAPGRAAYPFHSHRVNDEMFESARVDGAGWWQTFRHITVPQLVPAIVFFGIVETITMLSWVFAYIYVMTSGGPGNSTVVSEWYIFQQVFSNGAIGIGAAAAVTLLAFVSVLIVARFWAGRRFDEATYD